MFIPKKKYEELKSRVDSIEKRVPKTVIIDGVEISFVDFLAELCGHTHCLKKSGRKCCRK